MWFQNWFDDSDDVEVISVGQLDTKLNSLFKDLDVYRELKTLERDLESKKAYLDKLLSSFSYEIEDVNKILQTFFKTIEIEKDYRTCLQSLRDLGEDAERLEEKLNPHYFEHRQDLPEMKKVMKKVRELDHLIANKIHKLETSPLSSFLEAKEYQKKYYNAIEEKEALKEEIDDLYRKRMEKLNKKSTYEERVEDIESKKTYEDLKDVQEEKEALEQKVPGLEDELEELVKYLHIPSEAKERFYELDEDAIQVLEDHEKDISDDRMNEIRERFETYQEKKQQLKNNEKRLRGHSIILERKEQKAWIDRVQEDIDELDEELKEKKQRRDDINPSYYIQELNKNIEDYGLKVVQNEALD